MKEVKFTLESTEPLTISKVVEGDNKKLLIRSEKDIKYLLERFPYKPSVGDFILGLKIEIHL